MPGSCAPSHTVWLQSNFGICPTHLLSGGSVPTERNVTLNFKYFQENPETIFQFVFDQPLFAFRIQRPAFAPLFKLPSASQQENRPESVTSPLYCYEGKPLCQAAACHSPLVPFGETPETIVQYAFDQPVSAFRTQRPAFAPLLKPPSASHSLWPEVSASV